MAKKKWYRRRKARAPRRSYGWFRRADVTPTALTAGVPETKWQVMKGDSFYSGTNVLDWSRTTDLVVERVIIAVAVTVATYATKALLRYLWGMRIATMDADDALPAFAIPSLLMADEDDQRTDWMWTQSAVIKCDGDVNAVYTVQGGDGLLRADFKPRRKLQREDCLVFQHAWGMMTGTGVPDAVNAVRFKIDVLLSRPGGQLS